LSSRRFYICLFIYFVALCITTLYAQQPVFRNYNSKDGLPSTEVYCAFQDSKGFMWFGTDGGISRFDGYRFQTFTSAQGLADNTVFGIIEDRHQRLWFRSLSGKICFMQNDSLFSIGANDSIVSWIKNSFITSFAIDSSDTIRCGLRNGEGYLKISPGYKAANLTYVKLKEKGIYLVRGEGSNFIHGNAAPDRENVVCNFFHNTAYTCSVSLSPFVIDNNKYCIAGNDSFLTSDDRDLCLITKTSSKKLADLKQFGSKLTFIKKESQEILIGLYGKGLKRFQFAEHASPQEISTWLPEYSVTDVLRDTEGGLWLSTLENGIYYAAPGSFTLQTFFPKGASFDKRFVFSQISPQCIVISNKQDTVDLVINGERIDNLKIHSDEFKNKISSFTLGAARVIRTVKVHSYLFSDKLKNVATTAAARSEVKSFSVDLQRKKIYITDRYRLLIYSKPYDLTETTYLLPVRTFCSYSDEKGTLWLGTINGLWSFKNGKFISRTDLHPLLKSRINDIQVSKDGTWYFATLGNGVIVKDKNKFYALGTKDGLPSDNCECIFIDSYNTVWVGTKTGLTSLEKIETGKNETKNYRVNVFNSGSDLLNQKIYQVGQSGKSIWISADYGLASHPLPFRENSKFNVPLYITDFSANNVPQNKSALAKLEYDQNELSISYTGIFFQRFGKLNYRYKLEGLDTAWTVTQNTTIRYPYLPPGTYKFIVTIMDENAISPKNAELSFTIEKPFWETWGFRTLAGFLIAAAIIIIFRKRVQLIRNKEEEKTRLNKQISEIETKALRAQMNPHFIFNAINSIQNYILKNESRTAQDYLARFARLIRNVLENSSHEYISLQKEIETLSLYIQLEQLRAPGKFTYSIDVIPPLSPGNTLIPSMLLQPFVENSILHAFVPGYVEDGKITISIFAAEKKLICVIEDNGIGRAKAEELKKNKTRSHNSLGMSVTEERISILNQVKSSSSQRTQQASLVIEDKMNEKDAPSGTRVTITLPFLVSIE
jgi:two-component sensor histidine kinase